MVCTHFGECLMILLSSIYIINQLTAPVEAGEELTVRTIEDEPGRHPNFTKHDLKELRDFIKSEPRLPDISDERLFQFHHSSYFNMTKTRKAIDLFYKLFRQRPLFSRDRYLADPMVMKAKEIVAMYIAPKRLRFDRQIIFWKLLTPDPTNFDLYGVIKYGLMVADSSAQLYGVANHTESIIDCENLRKEHFLPLAQDLRLIQEAVTLIELAAPLRPSVFHFINTPNAAKTLREMAERYMSEELRKKMKIYGRDDMDKFREAVPAEVLPRELNGTLGTLDVLKGKCEEFIKIVEARFAQEGAAVDKVEPLPDDDD